MIPLLLACAAPEEPPGCPAGTLDDAGSCVPEACGTGSWGDAGEEASLFVDAAASGDGSAEAPFGSIAEALAAASAGGGGRIAVAAGTYAETVHITSEHGDVALRGRCADLVSLDGSAADPGTPTLWIASRRARDVDVGGLTIGPAAGAPSVVLASGDPVLSDLTVRDAVEVGILAVNDELSAELSRVRVTDTKANERGEYGIGLMVQSGATAELRDSTVASSATMGILVTDAEASLDGVAISGGSADGAGLGLGAIDGTVEIRETTIVGARSTAIFLARSTVTLTETTLSDTEPDADGHGWGVASYDSTVALEDVSLLRNAGYALYVEGGQVEGSRVRVADTRVNGPSGVGVYATSGALVLRDSVVEGNADVGILAAGDSSVTLERVEVAESAPDADGTEGHGIVAWEDAALSLVGCTVHDHAGAGLLVAQGAVVTDSGSTFEGNHAIGVGLGVVNGDARTPQLDMDGSSVADTRPRESGDPSVGYGIEVDGGILSCTGCVVERSVGVGVFAGDGATARFADSIIRDTSVGSASDAFAFGIQALDGAQVLLERSALGGLGGGGVVAIGEGTEIVAEDVTISDVSVTTSYMAAAGVFALDGASVDATDLAVHAVAGAALYAETGASVACSGCDLRDASVVGAFVSGAVLTLEDTTVADNGGTEGVGVMARDGTVTLSGVRVLGSPRAAIWLSGPGSYRLVDVDAESGDGVALGGASYDGFSVYASGVDAWDGETGLDVTGGRFAATVAPAVFFEEASGAFSGASVSGFEPSSWQQGCADVTSPPPGLEGSLELCPDPWMLVLPFDFSLTLQEAPAATW